MFNGRLAKALPDNLLNKHIEGGFQTVQQTTLNFGSGKK